MIINVNMSESLNRPLSLRSLFCRVSLVPFLAQHSRSPQCAAAWFRGVGCRFSKTTRAFNVYKYPIWPQVLPVLVHQQQYVSAPMSTFQRTMLETNGINQLVWDSALTVGQFWGVGWSRLFVLLVKDLVVLWVVSWLILSIVLVFSFLCCSTRAVWDFLHLGYLGDAADSMSPKYGRTCIAMLSVTAARCDVVAADTVEMCEFWGKQSFLVYRVHGDPAWS